MLDSETRKSVESLTQNKTFIPKNKLTFTKMVFRTKFQVTYSSETPPSKKTNPQGSK